MILPIFPLNFPINCFCFRIRSSSDGSRNKSTAKEDRMLDCLLRGRPTVIRVCVTPSSVAVIYCLHFHRVALFPIKWHRPVRLWIYYIDAIDSAPDDGWHSASISIPSFRPPFPFLLFFFFDYSTDVHRWRGWLNDAPCTGVPFCSRRFDNGTARQKMVSLGQIVRRKRCAARRGDKWKAHHLTQLSPKDLFQMNFLLRGNRRRFYVLDVIMKYNWNHTNIKLK